MKKQLLLILLSLLPMVASADDSGSCGDNVTYTYIESTHTLTISGSGAMTDYYYRNNTVNSPWYSYSSEIGKAVIEDGVTSIGNSAFDGCRGLTSITIPNSVTSIGYWAFHGCSGLTSVNIPNSVTSIDSYAFYGCSGLTSVAIPNSVTSIGSNAFYGCSGLTSVTIPNSVTSIDYYAFAYCSGLTSITIPNSVTAIGEGAFRGCSGLTSVNIPNSVITIGACAFENCSGLTSVTIPNSVTSIGSAFSGCSGLTSVTIPNSVTSIGGAAFRYSGLTSVTIPNSVTSIGDWAFDGCNGLTSVTIPNSVTAIGEGAFRGCSGLTSVTIPNSVTSIGQQTFAYCSGLTSVNIPDGVTSVGDQTFYGCSGLTSATIPNGVTCIGESAFFGCNGLTSLALPNQLSIIRANAFSGCSSLESLTIPASVEYIYQYAFSGCTSLTNINAHSTTPPFLYDNSFSNFSVPVNVPSGCAETYRAAQGWSNFTTINDGNVYYQLSVTADNHGTVKYNSTAVKNTTKTFDVKEGDNASITITADDGYQIATATVNGENVISSMVNGVVTFSMTISNITENKAVVVTFSRLSDNTTITLANTMETYCGTEDLDFSTVNGLKAYTATGYDHGTLTVTRVLNAPAGTGLLLKGETGSYDVPYATTTGYYINLLHGVTEDTWVSPTEGNQTNFLLGNKSGVTTFYRLSAAGTLAGGKAYLQLPTSVVGEGSNSRIMRIVAEDETTGMSEVLMDNGQWTNADDVYDLQGQRVAKPSKGLYIVNGRKVVVK